MSCETCDRLVEQVKHYQRIYRDVYGERAGLRTLLRLREKEIEKLKGHVPILGSTRPREGDRKERQRRPGEGREGCPIVDQDANPGRRLCGRKSDRPGG